MKRKSGGERRAGGAGRFHDVGELALRRHGSRARTRLKCGGWGGADDTLAATLTVAHLATDEAVWNCLTADTHHGDSLLVERCGENHVSYTNQVVTSATAPLTKAETSATKPDSNGNSQHVDENDSDRDDECRRTGINY